MSENGISTIRTKLNVKSIHNLLRTDEGLPSEKSLSTTTRKEKQNLKNTKSTKITIKFGKKYDKRMCHSSKMDGVHFVHFNSKVSDSYTCLYFEFQIVHWNSGGVNTEQPNSKP